MCWIAMVGAKGLEIDEKQAIAAIAVLRRIRFGPAAGIKTTHGTSYCLQPSERGDSCNERLMTAHSSPSTPSS